MAVFDDAGGAVLGGGANGGAAWTSAILGSSTGAGADSGVVAVGADATWDPEAGLAVVVDGAGVVAAGAAGGAGAAPAVAGRSKIKFKALPFE